MKHQKTLEKEIKTSEKYIDTLEREIQKAIKLTIESERINYLGINLFKETKELYSEN